MPTQNVYSPDYDAQGNPKDSIPELKDAIENAVTDAENLAQQLTGDVILQDGTDTGHPSALVLRDQARTARDDAEEALANVVAVGGVDGTVQSASDLPSSTSSGDYYYVVDQAAYYRDTGNTADGWEQKATVPGTNTVGADEIDATAAVDWQAAHSFQKARTKTHPQYDVTHPDFGAVGDGATDDSAAVQAAVDSAYSAGGGIVFFPQGTYIIEAVEMKERVYLVGAGRDASRLRLPSTPSDHLLEGESGTTGNWGPGGIRGLSLEGSAFGQGRASYNGLDFREIERLQDFRIENVRIERFSKGYRGSQDDRYCPFERIFIRNCGTGIYVKKAHPNIGVMDVRDCDVGLGGDNVADLQVSRAKFNNNNKGVSFDNGIDNSTFTNCHFSTNDDYGIKLNGVNNRLDNCAFFGNGTSDVGVLLQSGQNSITNCNFRPIGGQFASAVKIDAGVAGGKISHNYFRSCDTCIDSPASVNSIRGVELKANQALDPARFVRLRSGSSGAVFNTRIADNICLQCQDPGSGEGVFEIETSTSGSKNEVSRNTVDFAGSPSGDAMRLNGRGTEVAANVTDGASIVLTSTNDTTRVRNNRGSDAYVTEAEGEVTIAQGGDAKQFSHGLTPNPGAEDFQIVPTEDLGSASYWWLEDIFDDTARIRVDANPQKDVTFAWKAEVLTP